MQDASEAFYFLLASGLRGRGMVSGHLQGRGTTVNHAVREREVQETLRYPAAVGRGRCRIQVSRMTLC